MTNISGLQRRALQRQRLAQQRGRKARRVAAPPPLSGWNTATDGAQLPAQFAFKLENMISLPGGLVTRRGTKELLDTGNAQQVASINEYETPTGDNHLLIGLKDGDTYVWKGGTDTPTLALDSAAGWTNGYWRSVQLGSNMVLMNGTQGPVDYSQSEGTITGATYTPETFPLNPSNLIAPILFKERVWAIEKGTLNVWYTEPLAIAGQVTRFTLRGVVRKGGFIVDHASITMDGGEGPDDYYMVLTSEGEVILYQGTDPQRSSTFAIVGRFQAQRPNLAMHRHLAPLGGQIFYASELDMQTFPQALESRGTPPQSLLSGAIRSATQRFSNYDGWDLIYNAEEGLMVLNVPVGPDEFQQYVLSTVTGAPCSFVGINSSAIGGYQGELLFGTTDGRVLRYTGSDDEGGAIDWLCFGGYSDFGSAEEKRVSAYRAVFEAEGTLTYESTISFDNSEYWTDFQSLSIEAPGTDWGADWGSDWSEPDKRRDEWLVGAGSGVQMAIGLKGSTTIPIALKRIEYEVVPGGMY